MALPKRTYIAPIVIAAAVLIAGLGYLYYHQSSSHDCGPVQTKGVLKAKGEMVRKGVPIERSMLEVQQVPVRFLPPNPIHESELPEILGERPLVDIEGGAMILRSDFEQPKSPPAEGAEF